MSGAVIGRKSGPVQTKGNWEFLQANIVDDRIVGTLKEGRVDRADWEHSPGCHSCRHEDGVFFRNPHVEEAVGYFLLQEIQACSAWHGCGNADDFRVGSRHLGEAFPEHVLIFRGRSGLGFRGSSCFEIEGPGSMPLFGFLQSEREPFSLLGKEVEDDGFVGCLGELKEPGHGIYVVTVDWSDVANTQFFKYTRGRQ